MYKKISSLLLCCILLLGTVLPAYAQEAEEAQTAEVRISTAEEFLAFAENCRLDTYSRNLTVTLEQDIDLRGTDFFPVPIFSGTFDGKGHTVSGLRITADGSVQGLFRYLTATAVVQRLSVEGDLHPGGSRNAVGAIAGHNAGLILNCSFVGQLSGSDRAGGIAGVNAVTGIIEYCKVAGEIHGDHFVGGIAGENSGVIRNCTNHARINTTPQQNSVELSDITMDTLTGTESANTVTDIGGISGISTGVIRDCDNFGDTGYPHMGYNIGGIAGTQSGYVADCENHGRIQGRKEVGGIVGQMEPASYMEYTEDTFQILRGQLQTMSGLVNRASGNAQTNANGISRRIGVLQDQTRTAQDAVQMLLPDPEDPGLPDPDAVFAARNTLSDTLSAMPYTLHSVASATQTTVYSLSKDLNAISGQINAMGQTLNNASENLGGTVTDISDQDTPELLSGKVERCRNDGWVLADLNAGGIAGAIAPENDLDLWEDWEINGDASLNFQSEIRAVILNCANSAAVTGKKQHVGGIAGWQAAGLIKDSVNTGKVDGADAAYVGGIAGMSTGYLRSNCVKAEVTGKSYAGGIAGSATVVTGSLVQARLMGATEKRGAILGFAEENRSEEQQPIADNYYLCVDGDPGAIDGISYSGLAEPKSLNGFMQLENLPQIFRTVSVRFLREDGTATEMQTVPGGKLDVTGIPAVPLKQGYTGVWGGLEEADLQNILFDMTFEAVYRAHTAVIETEQTRENGLPLLLLEGAFTDQAAVSVRESGNIPVLDEKETLLEAWTVTMKEAGHTAHLLLPEGTDAARIGLYTSDTEGALQELSFSVDGSYLVFPVSSGTTELILVHQEPDNSFLVITGFGILLAAGAAGILCRIRKHRKNSPLPEKTEEPI